MAGQGTTEVEAFESRVDAELLAVSQSRIAFEGWVRTTQVSEDVVQELSIVFSELMANAVHAMPSVHDQIEASAWTEGASIVVRIANPVTPSSPPVTGPDLDDPLRTGGRGLLIVRAYTDTLKTELTNGTIAIRCERRISD